MSRFEEDMKAAHKRAIMNKDCNGQEDCGAPHHLCICLSLKGEKDGGTKAGARASA